MPGRGFIICWIFYYFFRNFLARVEFERRSGLKFCFLFFGLSHPVLAKITAGNNFLNVLVFYNFFRNFLARVEYEPNSGLKFFLLFFSLSQPVLVKTNAEKGFYIFLNFFTIFFSKFSFPGLIWTEFGTKILFSLFRPISSCFF